MGIVDPAYIWAKRGGEIVCAVCGATPGETAKALALPKPPSIIQCDRCEFGVCGCCYVHRDGQRICMNCTQ